MDDLREATQAFESTTVKINRTAAVAKGGRRFSFGALVTVGNRRGSVGIGYGKAKSVPAAIEKAQKDARRKLFKVALKGGTLPHPITGRFCASSVRLIPAAPGTGVIAGGTVRAVLEMAGVQDCLTKSYGSTTQKNLCKAAIDGLQRLQTKEDIAQLRGVEIGKSVVERILDLGQASVVSAKMSAPVDRTRGGGRRGAGQGRGKAGATKKRRVTVARTPAKASTAKPGAADKPQTKTDTEKSQ